MVKAVAPKLLRRSSVSSALFFLFHCTKTNSFPVAVMLISILIDCTYFLAVHMRITLVTIMVSSFPSFGYQAQDSKKLPLIPAIS
jgi:hypothetical protein